MRPPPRLIAVADDSVVSLPDYPTVAAGILSLGPAVAIVVATVYDRLPADAERIRRLARPSNAATFVKGSVALARAIGAQGVVVPAGEIPGGRGGFPGLLGVECGPGAPVPPPNVDFFFAPPETMIEARPPGGPIWYLLGGDQANLAPDAKARGAFGMVVGGGWWTRRDPVATCAQWLAAWDAA